jgi:hypothetical protein
MFATPGVKDVHIDSALSNVSVQYKNADLVAEKIFPVITVKKDSDTFFKYGRQDWRIYDDTRAPGTRAKRMEFTISTATTYALVEHALEGQIIDQVRDNVDEPIKYESDTVEEVTNTMLLRLEYDIVTILKDATQYASGNNSTPTVAWDSSVAIPIYDVDYAKEAVRKGIGRKPNTMVVSENTHRVLRSHAQLLDLFKYTRGGTLQIDQIKSAFEIENYIILGGIYVNSKEGQTETTANLFGNYASLLYITKTPGIKQMTFGNIFRKQGYRQVKRWREEWVESDFVRVADKYQYYVVSPDAGYLLSAVTA